MLLWSDSGRLEMAAWWRKAGLSTLCLESGEKVGQERELVDLGGRVFTVKLWSGPCIRSCKLSFPSYQRCKPGPTMPCTHFGAVSSLDQICGIKLPSMAPPRASSSLIQHTTGAWMGSLLGVAAPLCAGGCFRGCSSGAPRTAL